MSLWNDFAKVLAGDISERIVDKPTLGLSVLYEHEFYGEVIPTREPLPFLFTSETNRRACAQIIADLSGEELKHVLKDANVYVGGDIVRFMVEYRQI